MANCRFILNSGDYVELNAGGFLLMNDNTCGEISLGGPEGGRVKKKLGTQLNDTYAKPQKIITALGESKARIKLFSNNTSKGRIKLKVLGESKCIHIPHQTGESTARIIHKTLSESISHLYFKHTNESFAMLHSSTQRDR